MLCLPAHRWALLLAAPLFLSIAASRADEPTGSEAQDLLARTRVAAELDPTFAPLRSVVERFTQDRAIHRRSDDIVMSTASRDREREFLGDWQRRLAQVDFAGLDQDGRIDYLLLQNRLQHDLRQLDYQTERDAEVLPLAPFVAPVVELLAQQRAMQVVKAREVADRLAEIQRQVDAAREDVEAGKSEASKTIANRAVGRLRDLRRALQSWYDFHAGYDPEFTWWARKPFQALSDAWKSHVAAVTKKLVGEDKEQIIGDPIGREALLSELAFEMIPYSPEELIEIANQEFAWCDQEMLAASRQLGLGEDWPRALELVKNQHVAPGEQPELIRRQAIEAIRFLEERNLVTIPVLCRESWRMQMMSPERQKVSPYFLGGEVIIVSFPTDAMSHEDKLMSLRSNNIHFCRATVHHELIPGHHLQGFMAQRYRAHRRIFRTPFLVEGWALYWEMLLWDLDFPQSPENRIGMLFWRMHRCARILLSLGFHLGERDPADMVEFLVTRVGHERSAAEAEVRRWVGGDYGPLYQAAYMLGGLQIRRLHADLVATGKMTNREFHDAILKENSIPIDMIRASLTGVELGSDYRTTWRFYDQLD